jgi:hypothetical protein
MKAISKTMLGAGAAAVAALSFATPADAQYRRHRDRGLDAGDIITGVAVLGGIAAITSAIGRDTGRYGYGYGYGNRYRNDYNYAVQACATEAQRMGRGRVQITDVDRTGSDRYRVRGIVDADYGYNRGYDRYDRDYGRYDRGGRDDFTCYARGNGRITDFRL